MKELIRKHVEEATSQVTELGSMELGSDVYTETVKGVSTLTKDITDLKKLELEQQRLEYEHEEKMKALEQDRIAKEKEMKDQKVKNTLTFLGIAVPTGVAVWATKWTWFKELNGINGSEAGKSAMRGLFKIFNRK